MDKAGKAYWDGVWDGASLPVAIDPRLAGLNNYVNRRFHEYFVHAFSSIKTRGKRLLEIGCGRSAWLPYFSREFGFKVSGIDYSELGCHQARQILTNEKVEGQIFCADIFEPPGALVGAFDVIVSFGVAEHFEDTSKCISAFSRFLAPGGLLITNIPNLAGWMGYLQKRMNRAVFDIHIPLTETQLARAHQTSGLEVVSCGYFLLVHLGVMNLENLKGTFAYAMTGRLRSWVSKAIWVTERFLPFVRPNRCTSPYISCLAIKRCA